MKNLKIIVLFFTATLFLTSCSRNDNGGDPINEEELITTLRVTLVTNQGPNVVIEYRDLDGDGPNAPIITSSSDLLANASYNASMVVLNETESPVDDITLEIKDEDIAHQFFYQVGGGLNITNITYLDLDENGNPLGLEFSLQTGAPSIGNFTITLRHDLDKFAEGVSEGNITNAGGDTDISVTFPLVIQ
ncbi:MAG: type 1 periplasmic binding fold superfamily protein [Flavobacteriaceae bacterium CG_4_8_14_3_um_filter_34_10]|nr:type 1 periplasmic binding fold superfamily protein [Flavobacteriia bacterium]OIP48965.1 MAG: hypothetical protein AUK33_11705 [Flavobacteriaceae bacterium CG2_30_34_30]PIQ18470.1 MAG: type 1 periplasmic binding fold superfamily protein [Flavobacteriaceae bacterium CG18_big_fil_WC_8_21_14_2_50_34_36]PIV49762.1 MAG: type 1 periplasmic binding fold superfamily protein [Flavobacteriaceae bacterium CG02_land_8_20_14_3_00_34_13]PIX08228.1 MAG: type 1 periplasmic binding fold superfamily protein [